jgi:teichuronic acid exporter
MPSGPPNPEDAAGRASTATSTAPLAVRAVGSSAWSMMSQVFQVVLGIGSFALLSRWLTPADYGLMGMAATVSSFIGVMGDAGVSSTVIRISNLDDVAEATAFWLAIGGGVVLAFVTAVAAPLVAHFYRNVALTPVSLGLASTFILAAPGRVSSAKLARQLRFRATTIISAVATVLATSLAVVLAAHSFGPWALVVQLGATFGLQSAIATVVSPVRMSPALFSRARAREFAAFGSQLSGFSFAITIGRALDNVLAGRLLGSSAVGFMSMGMKLVYAPVERLCGAIYTVFLPTTVEIEDVEKKARAFYSAMRLLLMIVGPFALGTVAIDREIVALLPQKWASMVPLVDAYALTSLLLPVNYLSLAVLVAHGRAGVLLKMAIGLIPVCWAGAAIGALSGSVLAMVCAWSFAIALGAGIAFAFTWRDLKLTHAFWLKQVPPLAVSAAMGVAVRIVVSVAGLRGRRPGFVVGAVAGVLIYAALAWLFLRPDVTRVAGLFGQALARKKAAGASPAVISSGT